MSDYDRNLQRFSDMDDVEVAEDDPDVRGWDVLTPDGHDIGEVKDLLVDTTSMKVRSLEVELEGSHFNWKDNRRVAIPVDNVRLDEEHDDVVIEGMGLAEIGRLEEYRPLSSSRNTRLSGTDTAGTYTGTTPGAFDTTGKRDVKGSERERLTRSEEEVRIGKREVEAGEVRVGKHVETEHVNQPVTRARERVHIERRPVAPGEARGSQPRFENDEIRVPVTEEEVIVEKRPVVKEELIISKDRVQETQNVEADVRKERFDVDKEGRVLDKDDDRLKGRR